MALFAATTGCFGAIEATQPNPNADPTQVGGDFYFSAKIDGESFTATSAQALYATGTPRMALNSLAFVGTTPRVLTVYVNAPKVGTFTFGDPVGGEMYAYYSIGLALDSYWYTHAASGGTITITEMTSSVVAGTFQFDGDGNTAATTPKLRKITEGKFRLPISP